MDVRQLMIYFKWCYCVEHAASQE